MDAKRKIAVIGLGYVGLPLLLAFAKKNKVIGYDNNTKRVKELKQHNDRTLEVFAEDFKNKDFIITDDSKFLASANFYIITVPTPIDKNNKPDLNPIISASKTIAQYLKPGDIVVYESTVYPGCTEEDCAPILEKHSGLTCGVDFKLGYSPERINPGDKVHTLDRVIKIVSGQDDETLEIVAQTYAEIITVGLHKAESIKIAEAAKIMENVQRDLNIALMNEAAKIFNKLNIETNKVIEAASTKWNFIKLQPGLVGGHCIGVDPYYLIDRARRADVEPQIISAARAVNDSMGYYVAEQTLQKLEKIGKAAADCTVGVLGMSFKENCSDLRNSRTIDIINALRDSDCNVVVHDHEVVSEEAKEFFGIDLTPWEDMRNFDALIIAVAHNFYKELSLSSLIERFKSWPLIIDVKSVLNPKDCQNNGIALWQL